MAEATEIATRMTRYLGVPVERCAVLANGWETTVFEIVLGREVTRLIFQRVSTLRCVFTKPKTGRTRGHGSSRYCARWSGPGARFLGHIVSNPTPNRLARLFSS